MTKKEILVMTILGFLILVTLFQMEDHKKMIDAQYIKSPQEIETFQMAKKMVDRRRTAVESPEAYYQRVGEKTFEKPLVKSIGKYRIELNHAVYFADLKAVGITMIMDNPWSNIQYSESNESGISTPLFSRKYLTEDIKVHSFDIEYAPIIFCPKNCDEDGAVQRMNVTLKAYFEQYQADRNLFAWNKDVQELKNLKWFVTYYEDINPQQSNLNSDSLEIPLLLKKIELKDVRNNQVVWSLKPVGVRVFVSANNRR